jgi:hypothetical protein
MLILFLAVVMVFGSLISVSAATSSPKTAPTTPTYKKTSIHNVNIIKKTKIPKKAKNKIKVTWKKKKVTNGYVKFTLQKKSGKKWKKVKTYKYSTNRGWMKTKKLKPGTYRFKYYAYIKGTNVKSSPVKISKTVKIKK